MNRQQSESWAGLAQLSVEEARLISGGWSAPVWWWLAMFLLNESEDFVEGWKSARPA